MYKYGESKLLVKEDGWNNIMVEEVKKKHNNEGTYKEVRAIKPVKAPAVISVIPLPSKYLYVQIWEE